MVSVLPVPAGPAGAPPKNIPKASEFRMCLCFLGRGQDVWFQGFSVEFWFMRGGGVECKVCGERCRVLGGRNLGLIPIQEPAFRCFLVGSRALETSGEVFGKQGSGSISSRRS